MEKIGVKVKLVRMDKPAWLDRFLNKSDFQMALEDFGVLMDINQRSLGFFRGAGANYGGVNSSELEELVMKWQREVDATKRWGIAHEIQRLIARDMLWCNITGSPYFQAYRDYVKGYHFMNQLERFLVAVLFDVLQRGLAPELIVPGEHGLEVEAVSFDVGMEIAGATAEEGVEPARRGDKGDAPGARRQNTGQGTPQVKATPWRRPRRVEVILLWDLREVDDEVRVKIIELLTRPPHALDQLGAVLPDVRLAFVVVPLLAHWLWPGRRDCGSTRAGVGRAVCV